MLKTFSPYKIIEVGILFYCFFTGVDARGNICSISQKNKIAILRENSSLLIFGEAGRDRNHSLNAKASLSLTRNSHRAKGIYQC